MRNCILLFFTCLLLTCLDTKAQVTTYYHGDYKLQLKNKNIALYSVELYDNLTYVTIEIIPTRNQCKLTYCTSDNTYINIDENIKLPIIGKIEGDYIITNVTDWKRDLWFTKYKKVKRDEKLYFTMVFAGRIPPGITNFTIVDNRNYGYSFSCDSLNNPISFIWTESSIKEYLDNNNDGICGIYEGISDNKYKLGCIKHNDEYHLIYLGGKKKTSWWQIGDTKAILRPSSTYGLFKVKWYERNKLPDNNYYIIFDGIGMKVIYHTDDFWYRDKYGEHYYIKMYPRFVDNSGSQGKTLRHRHK